MKFLTSFAFLCLSAAWAQSASAPKSPALPQLPDDTVVAVFDDGTQFTMGDFKKIYAVLPPQNQQMALRDRKTFLEQWAFMRKLSKMAEKEKLDEQSPTKEALDYYRMMILSQAKVNDVVATTTVEPAEIVKYYDVNKEKYKQVRVKAIYIKFSTDASHSSDGKPSRTEEEAKAKADKLLSAIHSGADFVKLVKEDSEDETSKAKDGDLAVFRPSDNIPDAIRSAVFALKQGDVAGPVRQPNGYYLLRAEEVTYRPLSEVRGEIFTQLKQEHYAQWLSNENKSTQVQFPSPAFLSEAPPAAAPHQ
jgi:peptidyl-prolyl cis-trans isomerase C